VCAMPIEDGTCATPNGDTSALLQNKVHLETMGTDKVGSPEPTQTPTQPPTQVDQTEVGIDESVSTDHPNNTFSSWVAGELEDCRRTPCGAAQPRTVECKNVFNGAVLADSECPGDKPPSAIPCDCDVLSCGPDAKGCDPNRTETEKENEGMDADDDYALIGCFKFQADDVSLLTQATSNPASLNVASSADVNDKTCMEWQKDSPCRSGFPFFSMHSDAQSPDMCFKFCASKGLDISAITSSSECRCGASHVNIDRWEEFQNGADQDESVKRPGLLFRPDALQAMSAEAFCDLRVHRYTGHYEAGSLPSGLVDISAEDQAYMDSVVTGTDVSVSAEEDEPGQPPHVVEEDDLTLVEGSNQRSACPTGGSCTFTQSCICTYPMEQETIKTADGRTCWACAKTVASATWKRDCWPGKCGPGKGPWKTRKQCPAGQSNWEECVEVKYWFKTGINDARKNVARKAAAAWRQKTCINVVEYEGRSPPGIEVGWGEAGCLVRGLGWPGQSGTVEMNLGWCNSISHLGNVIHEFGHAFGMNHYQKRADATHTIMGHGPHLTVNWENMDAASKAQWQLDVDSYMGSSYDGANDPHSGYSAYDFESIMHYPVKNNKGVQLAWTNPRGNEGLTGQRKHLTDVDVSEMLDTYQCKKRTGSGSASTKTVGTCSTGSECTSGFCRGGFCCNAKGSSAGCNACYSAIDGDCRVCDSGYVLTNYECQVQLTPQCKDEHVGVGANDDCASYANGGFCTSWRTWMTQNCKKTCNLC